MNIFHRCVTAVTASLMVASPVAPIVSAEPVPLTNEKVSVSEKESLLTPEERASFESMEKYIDVENTTFDYSHAKSNSSIDSAVLDEYSAALLSQGWDIDADSSDLVLLQEEATRIEPALTQLRAACEGRNGFQITPPAVLLNSCSATAVQNAYTAGAGAAGLAAFITSETGVGPVIAGGIAGLLAVSSGLVGLCNSWGHGVKIFVGGGCWSQ